MTLEGVRSIATVVRSRRRAIRIPWRGLDGTCDQVDHSSLTAQNGGRILFTDEAMLLANVSIDIPEGDPLLPATLIASPTVILYGEPWHSYWIDRRDTRLPDNPWVFAARVPLLVPFQAFAPAPPTDTEFRLFEFFANPPIVDLVWGANHQFQMVLYGTPNTTAKVLSTLNLQAGALWQPWTSLSMTNAFRVLDPVAAPDAKRFFKGASN